MPKTAKQKESRFAKKFFVLLSSIFVGIAAAILFCSLFVDGEFFAMHNYNMLIVILTALGIGGILFLIYRKLWKSEKSLKLWQEIVAVSLVLIAVLAVGIVFARKLAVFYSWDPNEIYWGIYEYFESGELGNLVYFTHYPFQLFLVAIEIIFIRVVWHLGITMSIGGVQIMLNILFVVGTILLIYLILRKLFNAKKALFGTIVASLFTPILLYVPILYTDTTSMFFIALGFYLFLWLIDGRVKKWWAKALLAIGFSLSELCAFELKATAIIALIAVTMYLVATFNKRYFKQFIIYACVFLAIFLPSYKLIQNAEKNIVDFSKQTPVTHWLMMAQQNYGDFNGEDVDKTFSAIENGEDVKSMNIQVIKERIAEKGFFGNIGFIAKKISYVWGDGTYYVAAQLNKLPRQPESIFVQIFTSDGKYSDIYIYIAHGFQLFMLVLFFVGAILTRKSYDVSLVLKLIVMGIFAFFLFWETTSRYLVNYTPLFIVLVVYLMDQVMIKVENHSIIESIKQKGNHELAKKKK